MKLCKNLGEPSTHRPLWIKSVEFCWYYGRAEQCNFQASELTSVVNLGCGQFKPVWPSLVCWQIDK